VYPRKGVDLFVECAAIVRGLNSKWPIRFVWIGQRLPRDIDAGYSADLFRRIQRCGLSENVAILDEVADLELAYASADLFFLSSRLDPLPNVAIDAALRGLPIICFDQASGIADLLQTDQVARMTVVPHLDVLAAAKVIVELANDKPKQKNIGTASRRLADITFDMEQYVTRLDDIARKGMETVQHRNEDLETIDGDPAFDPIGLLGLDFSASTRREAIQLFLARSAAYGTGSQPTANFYYRRPCPGFHPQIYAYENSSRFDASEINPLAHFIRNGKPNGPWRHDVITPVELSGPTERWDHIRAGLHVHFYYPELHADFLNRLAGNAAQCDLLLSTTDNNKARVLRKATANYSRGEVLIRVVPNRGRDIGAFLTAFSKDILEGYNIIGHVHSKRSLFTADLTIGERWRNFSWENLIGGIHPMLDIILRRFADDEQLGIVFPDDPHLCDWDFNRPIAEKLAKQIGIKEPLPPFFDFPVGTMFWARTAALTPLFNLGLDWNDYPKEPVPIDGTILHALERILPLTARYAGYRYAATYIPGITW
jgi:hypothetical protein